MNKCIIIAVFALVACVAADPAPGHYPNSYPNYPSYPSYPASYSYPSYHHPVYATPVSYNKPAAAASASAAASIAKGGNMKVVPSHVIMGGENYGQHVYGTPY